MHDTPSLGGKVAIVTGGSRGIGLAIATALVAQRVDVVVVGRSPDALSNACNLLANVPGTNGDPGRVESVQADVGDASQAQRAIEHAIKQFGGLDVLINNAGVSRFQNLAELSVDDWREVIGTNLDGAFFCCRAALPALRRRGGGWIINVSSLAGSHPFARGAAYCASKAGLDAMSEALMQEVRYDKIRVSLVVPGSVDTRFVDSAGLDAGRWKLSADDVARVVVDLLGHDPRSLPSRVEIRPSRPRK